MKKQVLGIIAAASLACAAGGKKGFIGWGVGGGLSLAVIEGGWYGSVHYDEFGRSYYDDGNYGNLGPGLELVAPIRFGLGKAGQVHAVPSINWWGRWGRFYYDNSRYEDRYHDAEFNLNFFDARYVPPVPASLLVKPYAGLGLLGFSIYSWRDEGYNWNPGGTEFTIIQNFFAGAEFQVTSKVWPYVQFKYSNGYRNDLQVTAGFTVQGKK